MSLNQQLQEIFIWNISLTCCTLDSLQTGQSRDQIPVGARFSAPIQTGPGTHQASDTMGTKSSPGEGKVTGEWL